MNAYRFTLEGGTSRTIEAATLGDAELHAHEVAESLGLALESVTKFYGCDGSELPTLDDLGAFAGSALEVLRAEHARTSQRLRKLAPNQHARRRAAERRLRELDAIVGPLDRAERRHVDRYVRRVLASS